MTTLDVELYGELIGHLEGNDSLDYNFRYINAPENRLSCALPIQAEPFDQHVSKAFFRGLLPEEKRRERFAQRLQIEADDDVALMSAIGGDCAGAVRILPSEPIKPREDIIYTLSARDQFCTDVRAGILISKEARLSLTGAQMKEAVILVDDEIHIPRDGRPTTHIIKVPGQPGLADAYDDVVLNEYLCLRAAKNMLQKHEKLQMFEVANAEILPFTYYRGGSTDHMLCVERFDREIDKNDELIRVHQEDFCQATANLNRYASQGGPRFSDLAKICDQHTGTPGLNRLKLFHATIFNFIIGNCDAHGRNFSLRRPKISKPDLAPLYDLVSTTVYGDRLSRNMAMPSGEVWAINEFDMNAFMVIASELGLATNTQTRQRVRSVAESAVNALIETRREIDIESVTLDRIVAESRQRQIQIELG